MCKGIIGEWKFFEAVAAAVRDPGSPLHGAVPDGRVLDMLVYVEPESFSSVEQGFVDGLAVCRLEDAVELMENEVAQSGSLMSEDQVTSLGERMLQTYGDLNRHKSYLHARMLARKHNRRKAMAGAVPR